MIGDITPRSPVDKLKRGNLSKKELQREFDAELVAAVVGMSRAFIARALDRPGTRSKTFTLAEVLVLLDVDGFQETFIPRSKIPKYLLEDSAAPPSEIPALKRSWRTDRRRRAGRGERARSAPKARTRLGPMRHDVVALLGHARVRQRAERPVGRRRELPVRLRADP